MMTLTYPDVADVQDDPERRREHRVDQSRAVRVFEPFAGQSYAGRTCDVSATGMRLRVPSDLTLRAGRFVSLSTGPVMGPAPVGRTPEILRHALAARVVWVRTDPDDAGALLVGVELYGGAIAAAA